jgi:hypothetical protein
MELNREQITKALEWCSSGGNCINCLENDKNLFLSKEGCMAVQMRNALALIKELTEENERLRAIMDEAKEIVERLAEKTPIAFANETRKAKADTVRKMQEALEHRIHSKLSYHGWYLKETVIAEIAKEMLEEGNNE